MITLFLEHEIANDHLRNKKLTGFCMSTLQGGPSISSFSEGYSSVAVTEAASQ